MNFSKGHLVKKKIDGFKFYLDPRDKGVSSALLHAGSREPEFIWMIKKEAKGALAIDIGANIGHISMYLCRSMDHVVCIEVDSRTRRILKKNIDKNGFKEKTTVLSCAISDHVGEQDIYYADSPNLTTMNKPDKSKIQKAGIVETKTIDQLKYIPDFIKMDIEGYEIEALSGGMKTFSEAKHCKILIEVHPETYSESRDFSKVLRELLGIGYNFKYVVSAAVACPDLFRDRGYSPYKVFKDGKWARGIYTDISNEDAIYFCEKSHNQYIPKYDKTSPRIVRSILLEK